MRTSLVVTAGFSVATALVAMSMAGCDSHSKSSTATSRSAGPTTSQSAAQGQPTDYTRLLIRAEDIDAPEAFTATQPIKNPDGKEGAATTFRDDDGSHVIVDTILILPDPAAATAALDAAKTTLPGSTTGRTHPVQVGSGGTSISGDSPDGSKGITMLRFTEGRAFVTLEFDGPAGMAAPPDFVADVGQKQDAAIKSGLPA